MLPDPPWKDDMVLGYIEISIKTCLNDVKVHDTSAISGFAKNDFDLRFSSTTGFSRREVTDVRFAKALQRLKNKGEIREVSPGVWKSSI